MLGLSFNVCVCPGSQVSFNQYSNVVIFGVPQMVSLTLIYLLDLTK